MSSNARKSAFKAQGFKQTIDEVLKKTQELYLSDEIPWVVGYSGGKDSTAVLQLVWFALADLPKEKHIKPVHVISTDTLVENPVVALWVEASLEKINQSAEAQDLPIQAHRLIPAVENRFWVNVIGKGYPAPRPKFRWCTDRLKIKPSETFIKDTVKQNGEAILVLGTRKLESTTRSANMREAEEHERNTREGLVADQTLDRVWKFTPIGEWSNDDVWVYLNQIRNPWGVENFQLQTMYQGATEDNECPLVVDTTTPSCGDSRFGCYVCTLVGQDKSLHAMIHNDDEKIWMAPLLELRDDYLDHTNYEVDRSRRDWRRMDGRTTLHINTRYGEAKLVYGPYTEEHRHELFKAVLRAQLAIQENGPDEVRTMKLLNDDDMEAIRRIWVMEKHEIEDALPGLYQEVMGEPYPGIQLTEGLSFGAEEMLLLKRACELYVKKNPDSEIDPILLYKQTRELLHIELQNKTMIRRAKLYDTLERAIEKYSFVNETEALTYRLRKEIKSTEIKLGTLLEEIKHLSGKVELRKKKDKEINETKQRLQIARDQLKDVLSLEEDVDLVHFITPQTTAQDGNTVDHVA
ncbi:DNA phosphorothioation system sulfurtransferase DndC [Endozoicomonas arenosclerae]|uniref:DNA phosphorothioation system sulfurtransferase DndC n=1 Tax=Endozoicomonas arenosclerae TaxID=1633495 RepID=UPI0009A24E90|nr:DNA phosphorothioation system sulfurtransferase DndC [Endozoicomonas arenosclerae]